MQLSIPNFSIGIPDLPVDVLQHHIFHLFPLPSLVSVSMVCRRWRSLCERCLPTDRRPEAIFLALVQYETRIEFLEWFSQHLSYRLANLSDDTILLYLGKVARCKRKLYFSLKK